MDLTLIRHPKVLAPTGVCYGQTDYLADPKALEQDVETLAALSAPRPLLWCSPLQRCRQLAQHIPSQNYQEKPELLELNFGDWEGRDWMALPQQDVIRWGDNPVTLAPPNGESFEGLCKRVRPLIDSFNQLSAPLCIVCHAGSIRALCSELLGWPPSVALNTDLNTSHGVQLTRRAQTWVLQGWNLPLSTLINKW